MRNFILFIFIIFNLASLSKTLNQERCLSIPCVLSAASMVERINRKIDPCQDFYEFACGSFGEDTYTPDETSSVGTTSLMNDKLAEYLLTLLIKQPIEEDLNIYKLAKNFYNSCMQIGELCFRWTILFINTLFCYIDLINERGVKPLKDILNFIGGWPLIDGEAWDEAAWNWEDSILKLREFITKRTNNIFRKPKEPRDKEDDVRTFFSFKDNF